jgi:phosphoglycerol transferase
MSDYDPLKGYLHSHDLRWTYGAVRGRPDDWMALQPDLAPARLATAAAAAGFGAVYVDRAGYADGGAAAVAALDRLTGPGSSGASADRRLEFFDLRGVRARLDARTTGAQRAQIADALLRPARLGFGGGLAPVFSGETGFRWAGPDARLTLDNPLGRRTVRFAAVLYGGAATPSAVTITLPDGSRRRLRVSNAGRPVDLPLTLRHGAATLRLQTAGPAAPNTPGTVRDLRLKIADPRLEQPVLQRLPDVAASAP